MLAKGMRDRGSEDKILQMAVLDIIRAVFELYGYLPLETPLVERMDVLRAKFAVGEDTDVSKEIFQVTDQGERELGLRFDMTVPLCRYVAMNPNLKMPFKRYVMGKVFRDGPIKLGRYREFWQADADIVGVPGILADCEGVRLVADVFQKLDLGVTIYFSSRELLRELLDNVGIDQKLRSKTIIALDKLKKVGRREVIAEMVKAGVDEKKAGELLELVDVEGSNADKMSVLGRTLGKSEALETLAEILEQLSDLDNFVFDPSLSRGLAYYTGFFFECFMNEGKISSSLVGTGRYDRMIGQYLDGKQDFAAVGISFGVSVICDALNEKGEGAVKSLTHAYVVPVSENERAFASSIAADLREAGINTEIDLIGKTIGKNFAYADSLGIPYTIVIGEDEVANESCTVKNMETGEQEAVPASKIVEYLDSK